jgi:hypothetical protein
MLITQHARQRFRERVANLTDEAIDAALSSPTIIRAMQFGARYVRLGTGQHVVINEGVIVTVLPKDAPLRRLNYFTREDHHA